MNRDQAIGKIKKCLALAKSSNPHEAAAALRQAQKLMAEHQVTEVDVTLADVSEHKSRTRMQTATAWEASLAGLVADAFGCRVHRCSTGMYTHIGTIKRRREWVFIGVGAASSVAGYAFDVLGRQCERDRAAHVAKQPKACKPATKTARGDQFASGWVYGVRALIEKFAASERNDALVEAYIAEKWPGLAELKTSNRAKGRNVTHNDLVAGVAAGRNAQLNHGVGGTTQRDLLACL